MPYYSPASPQLFSVADAYCPPGGQCGDGGAGARLPTVRSAVESRAHLARPRQGCKTSSNRSAVGRLNLSLIFHLLPHRSPHHRDLFKQATVVSVAVKPATQPREMMFYVNPTELFSHLTQIPRCHPRPHMCHGPAEAQKLSIVLTENTLAS